jgi:hypothetical protein
MRDGYLRGALSRPATPRQQNVVAAGRSVPDAAVLVGVRPSTAKRHLADLRARSGLSTEQLIYAGRAVGWLVVPSLDSPGQWCALSSPARRPAAEMGRAVPDREFLAGPGPQRRPGVGSMGVTPRRTARQRRECERVRRAGSPGVRLRPSSASASRHRRERRRRWSSRTGRRAVSACSGERQTCPVQPTSRRTR